MNEVISAVFNDSETYFHSGAFVSLGVDNLNLKSISMVDKGV